MAASSKTALIGGFAANLGIAITKFIVGGLTRSTVMISEGIHSLVDTGNSGLMLYGRKRSRRAPDAEHPFGYGMDLYFWSFVVATIVFGGGGGLSIYEGIDALVEPRAMTHAIASYATIGVAAIFEGASLKIGLRELNAYRRERNYEGSLLDVVRASKDPAMFLTVLEDLAALIGLAIAAAGIALRQATGIAAFDGAASILIGLVLCGEALLLGVECRGLIIGESARPIVVDRVRQLIAKHADGLEVGELRTLQLGPASIIVFIELRGATTADVPASAELARVLDQLSHELHAAIAEIRNVYFSMTAPAASRRAA